VDYPTEVSERVDALNARLAATGPLGARWWSFTVSHKTFELVIGAPDSPNNLVIILGSCISISGPVDWADHRLHISFEVSLIDGAKAHVFELRDDTVGFKARSNMFTFRQGWDLLETGSAAFPNVLGAG
jgi:hypothetical protein